MIAVILKPVVEYEYCLLPETRSKYEPYLPKVLSPDEAAKDPSGSEHIDVIIAF